MRLFQRATMQAGVAILALMGAGWLPSAKAEAPAPEKQDQPAAGKLTFKIEKPQEAAKLAREIVRTFMSDEDYEARRKSVQAHYQTWHKDNPHDMGRYLNDRLIPVALPALGGDVAKMKEAAVFLSYYDAFKEPLPTLVTDFVKRYAFSMNALLADFTWEKAARYVKNRQWQADFKARGEKERSANDKQPPQPTRADPSAADSTP